MPTPQQIVDAAAELVPPTTGNLSANDQTILFVNLRKYLYDTGRSGGYPNLQTAIAAQTDIKAAILKAVLNNLNEIGSDVAALSSSVNWNMPDNVKNELEYALFTMYEPIPVTIMGSKQSDMATIIRALTCGCRGGAHFPTCSYFGQPFHAPITRY